MSDTAFDLEALLDMSVNFVPMLIIVFFSAYFLLYNPFNWGPAYAIFTQLLLLVPFVFVGALTIIARKVIAEAESERQ